MRAFRDIPWPRILAEGAAILVSILLAFAIDAWWDKRQDRVEERAILEAIVAEIDGNLVVIEDQLAFRADQQESVQALFDASDGEIDLSPDEIDRHIGAITFWARSNHNTGVIDSLISGTGLTIVSDPALRAQLTHLQSMYVWVDGVERSEEEFTRQQLDPFLMKNSFFPQIANATEEQHSNVLVPPSDDFARGEGTDHTYLLQDREFLGLLVQERFNHEDATYNLEDLERVMREVRAAIESDLRG